MLHHSHQPFMGGQDAHPTKKSLFVEQASCLFLIMVQDARKNQFRLN